MSLRARRYGATLRLRCALFGALILSLAACQTHQKFEGEIFGGRPQARNVRDEVASSAALRAPAPTFKRLKLEMRAPGDGHVIGTSIETLQNSANGFGQYLEDATYRIMRGKCTVLNRVEAVSVGGFLMLQEVSENWSSDCEGWGTVYNRRELRRIESVTGRLFPLAIGNVLELKFTVVSTERGRDEGVADVEQHIRERYEVVERIADYCIEATRCLGEVFALQAVSDNGKRQRKLRILYSTALNWRIGYSTDLRVVPIEWQK